MKTTITEGLAEIKTIEKRLMKKREFFLSNVARSGTVASFIVNYSPTYFRKEEL